MRTASSQDQKTDDSVPSAAARLVRGTDRHGDGDDGLRGIPEGMEAHVAGRGLSSYPIGGVIPTEKFYSP